MRCNVPFTARTGEVFPQAGLSGGRWDLGEHEEYDRDGVPSRELE